MQGLGAAILVSMLIAAVVIAGIMVVTPSIVKIKQLEYQIQLSQERMSNNSNVTKIILGGFFGLGMVLIGGLVFLSHQRDRAWDFEQRRLELEAKLEQERIRAQAYRQALAQAERQGYVAQLPEYGNVTAIIRR